MLTDPIPEQKLRSYINLYTRAANNTCFPVGFSGTYLFSYANSKMVCIDQEIEEILGISSGEILDNPFYDTISRVIIPEHVYAVARLTDEAYQYYSNHPKADVHTGMEFNIITPAQKKKRLLFQFRVFSWSSSGKPALSYGRLTDFTHMVSGGAPRVTLMMNGKLKAVLNSKIEEVLAGSEIPLTARELSVLLLKHRGYRSKEIASILHLREASVYSIIRDIKKKSGMDILPLIRLLQEKGAIQV